MSLVSPVERELGKIDSDDKLPELLSDEEKPPEVHKADIPALPRGVLSISSGWTPPPRSPTPRRQASKPEARVRDQKKLYHATKIVFSEKPEEKGWTTARKRHNQNRVRPNLNDRVVVTQITYMKKQIS